MNKGAAFFATVLLSSAVLYDARAQSSDCLDVPQEMVLVLEGGFEAGYIQLQ